MIRRPPRSPLFPYPPLFRSWLARPLAARRSLLALEVIRPQRRLDEGDVQPQNSILVGIGDGGQRVFDLRSDSQPRGVASAHARDRKSTRLNSSHSQISYAVF